MRPAGNAAISVERFFQLSLFGLVASGYLAVAGSGYLDKATVILTMAGLSARLLLLTGVVRFSIPERLVTAATLAYIGFYPIDYQFLSHGFLQATVHLVFFLAVMKILTARGNRDYIFTAAISFLEILAAAILSARLNFFLYLALYLLSGIAAFTSAEIRGAMQRPERIARAGLRSFQPRLAGLAAGVTLGILILTAALFFLLPRTANAALRRMIPNRYHLPGFSNQVSLDEIGEIKRDSRPVMHVRTELKQLPPNLRWRGAVLADFDGKRWSNRPARDSIVRLESGWGAVAGARERSRNDGTRISYRVELNGADSDTLFIAGVPEYLAIPGHTILRSATDTYRLQYLPPDGFRYTVSSFLPNQGRGAGFDLPERLHSEYLRLPVLDPRIPALARTMSGAGASAMERARAIEMRLRTDYGYSLDLPARETADPLAQFLFVRRKGHCEYFASAMTVMLRSIGIPARMVTGFLGGAWNPLTEQYVIRASDAHSWVEGWIDGAGWITWDPTPPDPAARPASVWSKLALYMDAAETFWQEWVLSYSLGRQAVLAGRAQSSSRRFSMSWMEGWSEMASRWKAVIRAWTARYGLPLLMAVILASLAVVLGPRVWRALIMNRRLRRIERGRASISDASVLYGRMLDALRRRGYQKPPWFTPNEFAASLPPETGMVVEQFTQAYNAMRFGGRLDAGPQLTALLGRLEAGEARVSIA